MYIEITDANGELVLNCASIVEEGTKNSLDTFDAFIVDEGNGGGGGGEFILGPVLDIAMLVGR